MRVRSRTSGFEPTFLKNSRSLSGSPLLAHIEKARLIDKDGKEITYNKFRVGDSVRVITQPEDIFLSSDFLKPSEIIVVQLPATDTFPANNTPAIQSNSTNNIPEVVVLSPSGGEVWTNGNFYTVRWMPLPETLFKKNRGTHVLVEFWLIGANGLSEAQITGGLYFSKDNGFQETEDHLSLTSDGYPLNLPPGKYKVQLRFFDKIPNQPCGLIDPSRPPCVPRDEVNYGMIAKGTSKGLITLESKK